MHKSVIIIMPPRSVNKAQSKYYYNIALTVEIPCSKEVSGVV